MENERIALTGMKLERQKNRMKRKDLAEATGISIEMLNRYENGFSELSLSKAKIIADALGCTINDLF